MKQLAVLFLLITSTVFSQSIILKGRIIDAASGKPLELANIFVEKTNSGTVSDKNGEFKLELNSVYKNSTVKISYVGYNSKFIPVSSFSINKIKIIALTRKVLSSQTVLIKGTIGKEGKSPVAFSKITRKQIEENYINQDLPEYLSYLPSTTFYSENGNGIGYNYLSIRGFDQRRISVSVNGIPQNDPEDHNVYWLDMPDLLEGTELVQVQRGAGAGVIGYPSIGGSINIITSPFSYKKMIDFSSAFGSYNTRKYSAIFSSGLISKKYSIYAKLSKILSSGYRNNSWVNFNSYQLSAVRYDKNITTQINIYGGPISDGLAYTGLPKFAIKNETLRRQNFSYWEADSKNYTFVVNRRPSEIENFSQPHYELLNEFRFSKNITLNTALFLIKGKGFFDYDGSWSVFYDDYFRLKANGFDSTSIPANALIRATVENTQWGIIPRLSISHANGRLIIGTEYRNHRSIHWGSINYAENLPAGINKDYRYYFYQGGKDILNFFINENYSFTKKLNVLAEFQVAHHNYKLFNEKYLNNSFEVPGTYFNPRIGLNYKFNGNFNTYFSFARVTREPRLKNYYDAAESSGGEVPQFELNPDGSYNFRKPLVKPEVMNDFELGMNFGNNFLNFSLNGFYMIFKDEIVKKGQVDRFGQPVTGNVDETIHTGVELSGKINFTNNFKFILNGTYSKNYIQSGKTYIKFKDSQSKTKTAALDLSGNRISGFPDYTFNAIVKYESNGLNLQLLAKYVGSFYSDNFDVNLNKYLSQYPEFVSYTDNQIDSYFVVNFIGSYQFNTNMFFKKIKIYGQVNNLFDKLYAAYGIGGEFFPAAERNFIAGIRVGI